MLKSKSKSRPGSGKSIVSVAWEENEEKTSVEENGEPEDEEEEEEGLHHEEDLGPLVIKGEDDIPKGCWFAFLQSFNGLWSTKDMNDGMDREIEVRTTVRELMIYLLFLFVIVICKNFTILLSRIKCLMFRHVRQHLLIQVRVHQHDARSPGEVRGGAPGPGTLGVPARGVGARCLRGDLVQ